MSTRSIIGSWNEKRRGWRGIYVHSDGYPSGVGASLFQYTQSEWHSPLFALAELILSVKQGFSVFNGLSRENILEDSYPVAESPDHYLDTDEDSYDMEYAYLIDPWNNCLSVLYHHIPIESWQAMNAEEPFTDSMKGHTWLNIGDFSFDETPPDWKTLDQWRPPKN